jgi:predicted nucleic acid-binding protein
VRYHLDTDFLIRAVASPGRAEFQRLEELAAGDAVFEMSALAWCEFARGPRSPDELAAARAFLGPGAVLDFTELTAERAADLFRRRKAKKRRAGDLAIAAAALVRGAVLLTGNPKDFDDIDGLVLDRRH